MGYCILNQKKINSSWLLQKCHLFAYPISHVQAWSLFRASSAKLFFILMENLQLFKP